MLLSTFKIDINKIKKRNAKLIENKWIDKLTTKQKKYLDWRKGGNSVLNSDGLRGYRDLSNYLLNSDKFYEIQIDYLRDYIEIFDIKTTESSRLYKGIQEKQIIFIHTQASNKTIDLSKIVENFINKENYIIICPNKNVYNNEHINYALADTYVMLKVAHYIDLILNAEELHVIDSCFSAMIYPLLLSEKLKAKKCIIYGR